MWERCCFYLAILLWESNSAILGRSYALVSMKRKSSRNKPFAFWRLALFSLPRILIAWYILSDTSRSGHKGNLEGLWTAEPLQYRLFAGRAFCLLVYRAIVNTSFAFPACRESWLHVAPRYGNFSVLRLNLHLTSLSESHRVSLCFIVWPIFSPSSFWKSLGLLTWKTRFWITAGIDVGLPGCAVFWDAKLLVESRTSLQ